MDHPTAEMFGDEAQTPAGLERLLTPDAVARFVGVSTATLAAWRSTRHVDLPFIRFGRLIRYRRLDVECFLAARTVRIRPGRAA